MKINIKDIPITGTFFTHHQFILFLSGEKCCHCDKKARWFPLEK